MKEIPHGCPSCGALPCDWAQTPTIENSSIVQNEDKPITIVFCEGVEGPSIYINDYRVCGRKPWGGGKVTHTWKATIKDLKTALKLE